MPEDRPVRNPGDRPAADRLVDVAGVRIVVPNWPGGHTGPIAAVSTRRGGVSRPPLGMNTSFRVGDDEADVKTNRTLFFEAAGIPEGAIATASQVHGSNVVVVERPGHSPDCDGLVTDVPGLFLGVSIADCVPVLLFARTRDRNRRVVAAVHSGWKGSRERIARRTVELMVDRFGVDPAGIEAYIGPSAGGCCYEVGPEVARHFPPDVLESTTGGKAKLDLQAYNRDLLIGCGVPVSQILASGRCTIKEDDTFHSHRRDRELSGRMLALIGFV